MSKYTPPGIGDVVERLFLAIALTACAGLLLAQVGMLRPTWLLAMVALLSPAYWRVSPRGARETDPGATPALLLAALLVFAATLFTPPFETTLWAGDASVYAGYGTHIGRTGAYMSDDSLLQSMPVERRQELFRNPSPDDLTGEFARLPGGIAIADIDRGTVAAGFAPLFSIVIAIFSQLFGASGAFWVAPVFGIGGVAAVFFLGRSLGGTAAGFVAGLLLAVSMPQVWFARIPMSEIVSQFFLIGGLWIAVLFLRSGSRRLAIASGFVLGVAGLTGFDVLTVVTLGIAVFTGITMVTGRRIDNARFFVIAYGTMVAYALLLLAYYPSNYRAFFARRWELIPFSGAIESVVAAASPAILLALAALSMAAVMGAAVLVARTIAADPRRRSYWGLVLCALIGVSLLVYFVPLRSRLDVTIGWLAAYLSWPLLMMFGVTCVGVVMLDRRGRGDPNVPALLAAFLVAALLVLYNPLLQQVDIQPWTVRRFVPFIFPGIILVASAGLVRFLAGESALARAAAGTATVAILLALVVRPSLAVVGETFWEKGIDASNELAAMIPENAVVLVSPEIAGTQAQAALTLVHGRPSVVILPEYGRDDLLQDQILDWLRAQREVFLLASSGGIHFRAPDIALTHEGSHQLDFRVLRDTSAPPRRVETRRVELNLYRARIVDSGRTTIDIGDYASDATIRLQGFFSGERDGAGTFRWTGPRAVIEVPAHSRIALVMAGARPEGVPPAMVSIWVDSRKVVGDLTVADAPTSVLLEGVDAEDPSREFITITIEASTFNPQSAELSEDGRNLGVRLYRLELRPDDDESPAS